jgi:hypothetical protein
MNHNTQMYFYVDMYLKLKGERSLKDGENSDSARVLLRWPHGRSIIAGACSAAAYSLALQSWASRRLRPVLITVAASVIAFIPLALHGGPL